MTINVEQFIPYAYWLAGLVLAFVILRIANVFRYIPNNQVGIVEKLWSTRGSIDGGFIALNGEAGYEPNVLRGGLHGWCGHLTSPLRNLGVQVWLTGYPIANCGDGIWTSSAFLTAGC